MEWRMTERGLEASRNLEKFTKRLANATYILAFATAALFLATLARVYFTAHK